MKKDFFCRVHTLNPAKPTQDDKRTKSHPPRLPPSVVVLDTETVESLALEFEFGCYTYCELIDGNYVSREEGIFFRDDRLAGKGHPGRGRSRRLLRHD